jgi:hypothetical protein
MADVIHHDDRGSGDSGLGVVVGVLIALVLVVLFWIFVRPQLRSAPAEDGFNANIDVNIPNPGSGTNTGGTGGTGGSGGTQ